MLSSNSPHGQKYQDAFNMVATVKSGQGGGIFHKEKEGAEGNKMGRRKKVCIYPALQTTDLFKIIFWGKWQ